MSVMIELREKGQVRFPSGEASRSHILTKQFYSFGRSDECDFTFKDPKISRIHFCLARYSGELSNYWLFDGEYEVNNPSRNGVYVNRVKVHGSRLLRSGDRIDFGSLVAVYKVKATSKHSHLTVY